MRSGPKTCNPVKCGWICELCKHVDSKKESVLSKPCVHSNGHKLVESPMMCNKCFALAGDADSLKSLQCPRALDFNEPPKKGLDKGEPKEDKSWITTRTDWEKKEKVTRQIDAARRELQRLQLMKQLQLEREHMADLIAKKRQNTSFLSQHTYMLTCAKNQQHHALIQILFI